MTTLPDDVCITLDVDWASDEVLTSALQLLADLTIPYTLFCTHPTPVLQGLDPRNVEIAWHPEFLGERRAETIIEELAGWFPEAVGVRAHALYFHSRLVPLYLERGMQYLGHNLQFAQPALAPATHWSGLVDIPGFWEDDVHALFFDGDFEASLLSLEAPGLKVFDFHPIHLALNTDRLDRYEQAREDIEARRDLQPHVNAGKGSRTFLAEVVQAMKQRPERYRFTTMGAVAEEHRRTSPYRGRYRV